MIGVSFGRRDLEIASEFFELFKTPWEPAVSGHSYSAVLSTDGGWRSFDAPVVVVYDAAAGSRPVSSTPHDGRAIQWAERTVPIYSGLSAFDAADGCPLAGLTADGDPVARSQRTDGRLVWQIGYDLFAEVKHLLTVGQPVGNAQIATLDLHIELLKTLLLQSGVSFLEVPPHPADAEFMCCLTHDVDFVGLKRHGFDATLAGFILRGSIGSIVDLIRGKKSLSDAVRNWRAVLSTPFVYLGLVRDPWQPFEDYRSIEDPTTSTFFVVPFDGRPGVSPEGVTHSNRAVRYRLADVTADVTAASAAGSEIAVHGIDAWRDAAAGTTEKTEVAACAGRQPVGVRMHWLYFSDNSPRTLEAAGFAYDSTSGYNETVGFRSGTSQVFKLPGTTQLLELPLSIMDSSLFSSGRLGLEDREAEKLCARIVRHATGHGGTVVLNWHCRSLAPERLWGRFYLRLIDAIRRQGHVLFVTAGTAVEWYRWRRTIRFERVGDGGIRVAADSRPTHSGIVRVHRPDGPTRNDHPFAGGTVTLSVNQSQLIVEAS